MEHYTQRAQEQRNQICALLNAGFNRTPIATEIGAHESTISRELRRNRVFVVSVPARRSSSAASAIFVPRGDFMFVSQVCLPRSRRSRPVPSDS